MPGKSKVTAWRSEAPVGPTLLAILFFAIMIAFLIKVMAPRPDLPASMGLRLTTTDEVVGRGTGR